MQIRWNAGIFNERDNETTNVVISRHQNVEI